MDEYAVTLLSGVLVGILMSFISLRLLLRPLARGDLKLNIQCSLILNEDYKTFTGYRVTGFIHIPTLDGGTQQALDIEGVFDEPCKNDDARSHADHEIQLAVDKVYENNKHRLVMRR